MIITNRFVYVHQPKTGGSFVTHVLFELRDVLQTDHLAVRNVQNRFARTTLKHGTCRDIPPAYRHLPILTTVRSPYDQYVSEYEFNWWRRSEYSKYFARLVPRFRRKYPAYPDLSFEQFVRLYNEALCMNPKNRAGRPGSVGWLTERFALFYFRKPWRALFLRTQRLTNRNAALRQLHDITFLRMHRLNSQLQDYLAGIGVDPERLSFVRELEPIRPSGSTRTSAQRWEDYYSSELRDFVRKRERLLFSLFPEFDH